MDSELKDKIQQTLDICNLHLQRMNFAKSKVNTFIPLTRDSYYQLGDETISFLDQYIYRFSKLQDTMGTRLLPSILEALAEPINDKAFIDILNRLEKLGIIESTLNWIQIRKIRNEIAHEYPTSLNERIAGINILLERLDMLTSVIEKCKSIYQKLSSN